MDNVILHRKESNDASYGGRNNRWLSDGMNAWRSPHGPRVSSVFSVMDTAIHGMQKIF